MFNNLYIHLPFCRNKCGYCAFYSESGRIDMIDRCLDRIEREIVGLKNPVSTVYVGGGTPTLLSVKQLERLGGMLPPAAERSIESNPETITPEKARVMAEFFNRVSTGVQSFDAEKRRIIGRDCSDRAIETALELLAAQPFEHRNIDLIYNIHGQTPEQWRRDLESALKWPVDHLSCYALTLDEAGGNPDDRFGEREAELSEVTLETVSTLLPRYEISNYAKPGCGCRHNLNVWRGDTYLGVGPAAASFDGTDRFKQIDSIDRWLAGEPPEYDRLASASREREIFAFNLRTVAGWRRGDWPWSWKNALALAGENAALHPEFWTIAADSIRLTAAGLDFWDLVAGELLDD